MQLQTLGSLVYAKTRDLREIPDLLNTAPYNGVYSHVAQFGLLWVFSTTQAWVKAKQMCSPSSRAMRCSMFYTSLSSHSDSSTCRKHMHLSNHDYFDYWKNPKTPKLSPMLRTRWRRFWDLWCISVVKNYKKSVPEKFLEPLYQILHLSNYEILQQNKLRLLIMSPTAAS